MPSPNKPSDPEHNTFELRAGLGNTDKWRGIRLQGSAAYLRPGELRRGENIRPEGDGYRERAGQAKIIDAPATDLVDGIFDFTDIGGEASGGHLPEATNTVLRPNGQGFYNQFTAGPLAGFGTPAGYTKPVAVADDVIGTLYGGQGVGTYIYNADSPGAGGPDDARMDSFTLADLDPLVVSVSKVVMKTQIHWLGGPDGEGGNPRLIMGVRLAGVNAFSSAIPTKYINNVTGYGSHIEEWDCTSSRPGGGAWSVSDVNAVEVIVRTIRTRPNNSFPPWIAALFLEVSHL